MAYGNINSEHGGIGVGNLSASGANFLNFCSNLCSNVVSRLRGLCGNGICWDGHWCSGEERVLRFCLEEGVVSGWRHCILRP